MTGRAAHWHTRQHFRDATGVLRVLRDPPAPPSPAPGQPPMVPGNPAEGLELLLAMVGPWLGARAVSPSNTCTLASGRSISSPTIWP